MEYISKIILTLEKFDYLQSPKTPYWKDKTWNLKLLMDLKVK